MTSSIGATVCTAWAFRQHPNVIFCASPTDPCSCIGGGFDIFAIYCNSSAVIQGNASNFSSENMSTAVVVHVAAAEAQTQQVSLLDAVDGNAIIIFISIGALIVVVLIFGQARAFIAAASANDARAMAEAKLVEVRETNLKIRKEL